MIKKSTILIIFAILISTIILLNRDKPSLENAQDPLLKAIQDRGEIIIGTDATYPPMESIDELGNFLGMDIDIANEIALDLNVKASFVNIAWEDIFDAVRESRVDIIISSITITSERIRIMDFSDPYFNAGQVVIVKIGIKDIEGVEDLKNYNVGVQLGTTSEQEVKKYVSDPSFIKTYENYYIAKNDLLNGKIDAIVTDYPGAVGLIAQEESLEIVGEPFTQEFYGVVIQKDQQVLLTQINNTIRRLKREGKFKVLEQKWLVQ